LNLRRAGNSFLGRLRGTRAVYYIQCRKAIILCEISIEDAGDFWPLCLWAIRLRH